MTCRCVFVEARDDGSAAFAGIRYASRLGDELTNWAIFEPKEPMDMDAEQVDPDDPDLLSVLIAYGCGSPTTTDPPSGTGCARRGSSTTTPPPKKG